MKVEGNVRTCLWFARGGLEAARYYTQLIPNSQVEDDPGDGPEEMVVRFSLGGAPFQILNGGDRYRLNPAASIAVTTPDQAETDRLWEALVQGGEASRCGWLVDRFGVSWQIVPEALPRLLSSSDRQGAGRAMQAMLRMQKIDVAVLEAAFRGETSL